MYIHHRFVWRGGGSMMSFDSMTRGIPKLLFGKWGGYQLPNGTLPPPPLLHYYNSRRVAVCPRRLLPSLIPCLFLSPTSDGKILPIFNPTDRRFYGFPIPKKVRGPDNSVRGSGLGWLVMLKPNINLADYYDEDYVAVSSSSSESEEEEEEDNEMEKIIFDDVPAAEDTDDEENRCTISLYNPFTGTHIPLPPILGNIISNGKVLCDPVKASPGQSLVSIKYSDDILLYCQGDKNWSVIAPPPGVRFAYCTYHEAEATLYVLCIDGRLSVLDPATRTLRPLIDTPSPEIQSSEECVYNLGVDAAGDVLMFLMTWRPLKYRVLKLDKTCLKWVRTPNIGNQALFMHLYCDSLVCDPGFTDAKPNQIYCFEQHRYRDALGDGKHIEMPAEVGVLDLTDAGVQEEQLLFRTSTILKGHHSNWYQLFGAWMMVPSHEFKD